MQEEKEVLQKAMFGRWKKAGLVMLVVVFARGSPAA
jgi:hypothetical protein